MDVIERHGGQIRVVGGAVRDALLGREVHDIDLAVNLPPERVTAILKNAGFKVVPTGIAHGTVTVVANSKGYEITTLRHDINPDGRHSQVEYTDDWLADAARRDFTFNALYVDKYGAITDFFDGQADLAARYVRFIGDPHERIREDVLRILRLFRFFAQIDDPACSAKIDPKSLLAAYELASLLPSLSAERVGKEIKGLLKALNPLPACRLMHEGRVLSLILPELTQIDRLERLLKAEEGLVAPDPMRRLAALLDGDPAQVAQKLRLSKHETAALMILSGVSVQWRDMASIFDVRQKLYDYGQDVTRNGIVLLAANLKIPLSDWLSVVDAWGAPSFPLQGKDIQKFGIKEGPRIGEILKQTERWWRSKDFKPDKEMCLAFAKEI